MGINMTIHYYLDCKMSLKCIIVLNYCIIVVCSIDMTNFGAVNIWSFSLVMSDFSHFSLAHQQRRLK